MKDSNQNSHWISRTIGAITVTIATFLLLWWWDTWELSLSARIIVSFILGGLFLIFGGSIWRWIDEIDTWS